MKSKIVSRENDINTTFEIIEKRDDYKENSENGLVILLNGSWGSGKTTFLKSVEKFIFKNDNYELFINYNSYEYDFYENAYLPFFACIEDKIKLEEDFEKLINCTNKNCFDKISKVIDSYLKEKIGTNFEEITDVVTLGDRYYLKNFEDFKTCKENIKSKLIERSEDKIQIVIIDELDRCKPSFAMETLEIIKHFFDIDNYVFIVAVDKLQLLESAKTIYGQEMDSEKYFSKFFDYQYNLLPLNFSDIVYTDDIKDLEEIINRSTSIFNYLNVSSRDSKKIFNEFIQKYRKFSIDDNIWTVEQSLVIIFFLTLKYVDLLFYKEIMNGNYARFKKKITDSFNPVSNNYEKLLAINIGEHASLDTLCNVLTSALNEVYIDKIELNYVRHPSSIVNNKIYERQRSFLEKLYIYIPQIEQNITYKETIERIIN